MKQRNREQIAGWVAVGISTAITSFWAFWGIVENFHEGWYHASLLPNLGLMFAQYLSPMILFMGIALVSVFWPRIGAGLHVVAAVLAALFFHVLTNTVVLLLLLPFIGLGALYWFGRPQPRRYAIWLLVGLPLLILVAAGVGPVIRVASRVDDGDLSARQVEGNGVTLVWAPDGPGWPHTGMDWYEAQQTCRRLTDDGLTLAPQPQNVWRLPAVEEAVRSMARHGQNSGGQWDATTGQAAYTLRPDKESPLWNVHSQVIYWWTATEIDGEHAYMIVYDGRVWTRNKDLSLGYLGFRCVK